MFKSWHSNGAERGFIQDIYTSSHRHTGHDYKAYLIDISDIDHKR